MSDESKKLRNWAHLRFSIVGPLLAQPPEHGELAQEIEHLSQRSYPHPTRHGETISFAASTVERWYYTALGNSNNRYLHLVQVGVRARARTRCNPFDYNLMYRPKHYQKILRMEHPRLELLLHPNTF